MRLWWVKLKMDEKKEANGYTLGRAMNEEHQADCQEESGYGLSIEWRDQKRGVV